LGITPRSGKKTVSGWALTIKPPKGNIKMKKELKIFDKPENVKKFLGFFYVALVLLSGMARLRFLPFTASSPA